MKYLCSPCPIFGIIQLVPSISKAFGEPIPDFSRLSTQLRKCSCHLVKKQDGRNLCLYIWSDNLIDTAFQHFGINIRPGPASWKERNLSLFCKTISLLTRVKRWEIFRQHTKVSLLRMPLFSRVVRIFAVIETEGGYKFTLRTEALRSS